MLEDGLGGAGLGLGRDSRVGRDNDLCSFHVRRQADEAGGEHRPLGPRAGVGQDPGLGRQIMTDVNFQAARAYAGTVLLIAFAVACFYTLALAERKLAPWRTRPGGDAQ